MKFIFRNTRISTRLFFGFSISMLVVITAILVSFENSKTIIKDENLIVHTHRVLNELKDIEVSLIDLETGQRGYIITGDLKYLEPYNSSLITINSKVDFLNKMTVDNPSQTERISLLKEMVDVKLKELITTINLRNSSGFEAAKNIVENDGGKIIMDKIRAQISDIRNEELRLLDIRILKPNNARKNTLLVHLILLVFSVIIILTVSFLTIKSIINPIKTLQKGVTIVGQGNLSYKFGITSKDEIGALSNAFEEMLIRLKTTMASKELLKKEVATRKTTEKHLIKVKTSLEKSETELIESNKTKDKFFSIVAHDLKNPFNSMLGFSNLLMENYETLSDEKKHYFSKIIHVNLESTYSLLENLLLWSRSQLNAIQFNPEEENLYVFFDQVIKTLQLPAELKSIVIKNEIPQDILISVDKNMLSTIIRNLIGNALKFTNDGGEINVSIAEGNKEMKEEFVEVMVQDNGMGISKTAQSKLFDLTDTSSTIGTANERGTGLGLVLCKEFVEKHGGTIWVTSTLGQGACFYFTLKRTSYFMI
ncbi:MAG: hypothetical protein COB60_06720 [Flavobacteriaceae bacterium]|nr:MAG: hypothetical protein COB60_06720 [Flavobacteriaceae bacterium]